MKTINFIHNLILGIAILIGVQSSVYAVQSVATVGTNTSAANVFYTGGLGGNLNIATNNAFLRSKFGFGFNPTVAVQFSQMAAIPASYVFNGDGVWHLWLKDPNNGFTTFTVTDTMNGNILLKGRFQRAILHGRTGSSSLAITLPLDNVEYNPVSMAIPAGFELVNGSFSIAVLSQNPLVANPAAGPMAFNANGDINFGVE